MKLLTTALCFFVWITNGATYFVATNGNNADVGSEGKPWLTVQFALNSVVAGDTIKLGQGFYNENANSDTNGAVGSRVILDGQGVAILKQLDIDHRYYTVQNLKFQYFETSFAPTLQLGLGAHWSIVSNCVFNMDTNYYVWGLSFETQAVYPWDTNCASDCLVVNNEFIGGSKIVIALNGFRNLVLSNYIHDVWRTEAVVQTYGGNNIIRSNRIENILATAGLSGHVDLFETTGNTTFSIKGMTNTLVEKNWCVDIHGQPVSIVDYGHADALFGYVFRNNVFIRVKEAAQNTITHSRFYNNTFYNCNWVNDGHAIGWSWSNNEDDAPPGTNEYGNSGKCFNNAFLTTSNGTASAGWYSFTYSDPSMPAGLPLTNCTADYNFVSKTIGGVPYSAVGAGSVPVGDGFTWSNQEFFETHGINGGNPLFVNAEGGNFRLIAGSPLINAGTNLSALFSDDIAGNPRISWSIGAFEFQGAINSGSRFRGFRLKP